MGAGFIVAREILHNCASSSCHMYVGLSSVDKSNHHVFKILYSNHVDLIILTSSSHIELNSIMHLNLELYNHGSYIDTTPKVNHRS